MVNVKSLWNPKGFFIGDDYGEAKSPLKSEISQRFHIQMISKKISTTPRGFQKDFTFTIGDHYSYAIHKIVTLLLRYFYFA